MAENLHANRVVIASGKHELVLPLSGAKGEFEAVLQRVQRFLVKALEGGKCSALVVAVHRGGEDCDHE